jgi:polyisoprenyl-phosphate glycosyltransferase
MKRISVVTPCFNEESNVEPMYLAVKSVISALSGYDYEHIFIDNDSSDGTVAKLKQLAQQDRRVKIIVNARNFGHIRSPYYGLQNASGEAVIIMAADFQEPPELIRDFIEQWEAGYKIVVAVKTQSAESPMMYFIRSLYYNLINRLSDVELIKNYTGFGLYDQEVVNILKKIDDPYPYLRGLICEIGFKKAVIPFHQPVRQRGITKNNFFTLYDMAMLGITTHSKVPLRIATLCGFGLAAFSLMVAFFYLMLKLLFWDYFALGMAPILIGFFFFSSVQLFFIGLLGEYILSIQTQVLHRPLVIEKERVNFDSETPN